MAKHPDLTEAIELALQFAQFVRQRQSEQLYHLVKPAINKA